jgi:hypothetical protein
MFPRPRHQGQGERPRSVVTHPCRTRRGTTSSPSPAAGALGNLRPAASQAPSGDQARVRIELPRAAACHTCHTPRCPAVNHGHSRTLQRRNQDRRSRRSEYVPWDRTSKLVMRVRFPSSALIISCWSVTFFGVRLNVIGWLPGVGAPHTRRWCRPGRAACGRSGRSFS